MCAGFASLTIGANAVFSFPQVPAGDGAALRVTTYAQCKAGNAAGHRTRFNRGESCADRQYNLCLAREAMADRAPWQRSECKRRTPEPKPEPKPEEETQCTASKEDQAFCADAFVKAGCPTGEPAAKAAGWPTKAVVQRCANALGRTDPCKLFRGAMERCHQNYAPCEKRCATAHADGWAACRGPNSSDAACAPGTPGVSAFVKCFDGCAKGQGQGLRLDQGAHGRRLNSPVRSSAYPSLYATRPSTEAQVCVRGSLR